MRRTMGVVTIVNVDQQNDIASGHSNERIRTELEFRGMRAFMDDFSVARDIWYACVEGKGVGE